MKEDVNQINVQIKLANDRISSEHKYTKSVEKLVKDIDVKVAER